MFSESPRFERLWVKRPALKMMKQLVGFETSPARCTKWEAVHSRSPFLKMPVRRGSEAFDLPRGTKHVSVRRQVHRVKTSERQRSCYNARS